MGFDKRNKILLTIMRIYYIIYTDRENTPGGWYR